MRRSAIVFLGMCLIVLSGAVAQAQSNGYGSAQLKYKILPIVKITVTPNYQSGFGPSGGAGSGSTPAPGALATAGAGTVDFGSVVQGYQYLYKYAAQVSVTTNDIAGFSVYAEGSTDFNGSNPTPSPPTLPISSTLYYLQSSAGNSPNSPASPFQKTIGIAGGAPFGSSIDYSGTGGVPQPSALIWNSASGGTIARGYDYQLRLPYNAPLSQFNVYVVYTVVGN